MKFPLITRFYMKIPFFYSTNQKFWHHTSKGQQKNENCPHQLTIKFTGFLPIKFLPLLAPP